MTGNSSTSLTSCTFWMVALPLKHRESSPANTAIADEDRNSLYTILKEKLSVAHDLAEVHQFSFPEFKVGTLDSLFIAGEDLAKMDAQIETVVNRLITNLRNILDGDTDQVRASLVINDVASPEAYIKSFQWNVMKYRTDKPVTEISETITQEIQQIDNLLKTRLSAFGQSKTHVAAIERKGTGSLLNRDLSLYVKPTDFIPPSDYMKTLLVVVPTPLKSTWESTYEQLTDMVVPRSSRCLYEETDYSLYNVTVFKKVLNDFFKAATAEKFTVRDFTYDEETLTAVAKADETSQADFKVQWASLLRLLKTNFGEIFSGWIHLKVLRLFVESVLHYGLPPQFLALVLKPSDGRGSPFGGGKGKAEKKLRLALLRLLEKLTLPGISPIDVAAAIQTSHEHAADTSEEAELWSALNMASQDENPFVKIMLKITI